MAEWMNDMGRVGDARSTAPEKTEEAAARRNVRQPWQNGLRLLYARPYMTRRETYLITFLLAAAAVLACWSTLPLIWDGGYQMSVSLITQEPYYYLSRFHSYFLWMPMVWLSQWTHNVTALIMAYGLPFLLAPAVSVAIGAWVVRPHAPGLAVWALVGVAVTLPGQVFVINDSIWQHTLFWPILLGALVPLNWPRRLVLFILAIFQFAHHIGAPLLGVATGAAWLVARKFPARRGEAWPKILVLGLLTVLAVVKIVLISIPTFLGGRYYDSYAAQQATFHDAWMALLTGVGGLPVIGLGCLAYVAWKLCRAKEPLNRRTWLIFTVGLGAWVLWSCLPWHWAGGINYRRWVGPIAAPFCLFAALDALRGAPAVNPDRSRIARHIGLVFTFVLCAQSVTWAWMVRQFRAEAEAAPGVIVRKKEVPSMKWSQLDHWGTTTTYMLLQGRAPAKYFAYTDGGVPPLTAQPPSIPLWEPHLVPPAPGPVGFFDHRPFLQNLGRQKAGAAK